MRQLRVSQKVKGLEARWWKCTRDLLGICFKKELVTDLYDFADPKVVQQMIDADVMCEVRAKP